MRYLWRRFIDWLTGCMHENYSFPLTPTGTLRLRVRVSRRTGTYVVCLDCGREIPYDMERMKVLHG